MSKDKMPWLKSRLREIGRTPAGLARHLDIGGPRVYEMIAGRRSMQPAEIAPAAEFLDWTIDELMRHLPEGDRVLPASLKGTSMVPNKDAIRLLGSMRPWGAKQEWDLELTGEVTRYIETAPALRGRKDVDCLYLPTTNMDPWRPSGDLVVFEKSQPPVERDHVVVFLIEVKGGPRTTRVMVRQLISSTAQEVVLRQHNPPVGVKAEGKIDRKSIAEIYRVMTWDDVIR